MNLNVISAIYRIRKMRKYGAATLPMGSKEEKSSLNILQCQFFNATHNIRRGAFVSS